VSTLDWWYSPHPAWEPGENWPEEVPVVRYETDDEVVLFDPFPPVDRDFDPHGKPVRVLLTQPSHYRGTDDFVERYGATIWAPPHAPWRRRDRPLLTDDVPHGIDAIVVAGEPDQAVFFVPEHGTLVSGDVLSGTGGRLHVFVDEGEADEVLRALDELAELPIERLIIPHGELIEADGAARIRAAVAAARRG